MKAYSKKSSEGINQAQTEQDSAIGKPEKSLADKTTNNCGTTDCKETASEVKDNLKRAKKPKERKHYLVFAGLAVFIVTVLLLLCFPGQKRVVENWTIGVKSRRNESSLPTNQNSKENCSGHDCDKNGFQLLINDDDYKLYVEGEKSILYSRKDYEIIAEFEVIESAKYYTIGTYNESWQEFRIGLILTKDGSSAYYNLITKKLTIPFGKYDDFVDWAEVPGFEIEKGHNFITSIINQKDKQFYGLVNITTGKEIIPCTNTVFYEHFVGDIIIIGKQTLAGPEVFGIVDAKNGKEIVKAEYQNIDCGEFACTIWKNNSCFQVYDIKKRKLTNIADEYADDKELAKMRMIIDFVGDYDFGTDSISDMSTLSNKMKLQIAFYYEHFLNLDEQGLIKASEIEKSMEKIFGPTISFTHANIPCDSGNHTYMQYDKKNKQYIDVHDGHGGHSVQSLYEAVVDYQVFEDYHEVTIKRLVALVDDEGPNGGMFGDTKRKIKLFNDRAVSSDYLHEADVIWYYSKNMKSYQDKSPAYKYIFKKVGNDYFLVGYDYIMAN